MKNNKRSTNSSLFFMTIAMIMMLVVFPVHADGAASEFSVFDEAPTAFDDNDTLGSYGDENYDDDIDEVTSGTESVDSKTTVATVQNIGNSSIFTNGNSENVSKSGYGDNEGDVGDI